MSTMREHSWRASAVVSRPRLAELAGDEQAEDASRFDQTGESREAGTDIQQVNVDEALAAALRDELAAVVRRKRASRRGRTASRSKAARASPTSAWKPSLSRNGRSTSSRASSRRPDKLRARGGIS